VRYRELGHTNLKVSAIGMGCWAIGGGPRGPVDDRESTAAIERALEIGIKSIRHGDWYAGQLATAQRLKRVADGRTLSQVALAFVLDHPSVSTAIPGAKTQEQIEQNAAAADVGLSDADRRADRRHRPAAAGP
jgi:aryl-alcohol dehydrogenase-like predicted oxidoreductase